MPREPQTERNPGPTHLCEEHPSRRPLHGASRQKQKQPEGDENSDWMSSFETNVRLIVNR